MPPKKPITLDRAASGVKPFDPKAFQKMQGQVAQDRVYQQGATQRAAARTPKPVPAAPKKPAALLDNITGMKSRRKI